MNENYINYIQSNTKKFQTVDQLALADMGTMGHYLNLDLPCENKNWLSVRPPSAFQTGNNQFNTHGPTLKTRPTNCSTEITSLSRSQQGLVVHWDIL